MLCLFAVYRSVSPLIHTHILRKLRGRFDNFNNLVPSLQSVQIKQSAEFTVLSRVWLAEYIPLGTFSINFPRMSCAAGENRRARRFQSRNSQVSATLLFLREPRGMSGGGEYCLRSIKVICVQDGCIFRARYRGDD